LSRHFVLLFGIWRYQQDTNDLQFHIGLNPNYIQWFYQLVSQLDFNNTNRLT